MEYHAGFFFISKLRSIKYIVQSNDAMQFANLQSDIAQIFRKQWRHKLGFDPRVSASIRKDMESRPESLVPDVTADCEPPILSPEKDSIQVVDNATGTTGSKSSVSSASPVVENATGSIDNDPKQVLPTMNDKTDSQKRAKTLSFFQRMAGQPAPASSAASAISAAKNEIVPHDKDLEESLPITNEDTGSQKNTKMVSFFQRMGGLGPDPNKSELSDAFASWVGDPHATLTDNLLIQPQVIIRDLLDSLVFYGWFAIECNM